MSKRKGNLVVSPIDSPSYSSPVNILRQSTSIFNSFNSNDSNDEIVSALTWQDSTEIMEELLLHFDAPSDGISQVERCSATIQSIQNKKKDIEEKAANIKTKVENSINQEEKALEEDQNALNDHEQHLSDLQKQIENLKIENESLVREHQEAEANIDKYKIEASQEIEQIDEVEAARVKEVPSLRHKISLYASITGIRWDFENEDLLKGVIAIPSKSQVRRFELDPSEMSEYEASNQIWNMMDGDIIT